MAEVNPIARKGLVYTPPGTDGVRVCSETYADNLTVDIYESSASGPRPVVVIAAGYPDEGFQRMIGCRFKDMQCNVDWAKSFATMGMTAVTYTNRAPLSDLARVIAFLRENAQALKIDAHRMGVFATSGNAPAALSVVHEDNAQWLQCIGVAYGYLFERPGSSGIAGVAKQFGFALPPSPAIASLPRKVAWCIARAGRDEMPHLNASIDGFVADALAANLPITLFNHPTGPHAFDLMDDSAESRTIVEGILSFFRNRLNGGGAA
ncbi:MAG: hypothetical protein M3Q69_01360 [Acidobacteriota bacterium]|nr:hypothetical protein [Acidobacteriota bacterium]